MRGVFESSKKFLGVQLSAAPAEKLLSAVGGFVSILLIFTVSDWLTDLDGALAILPSMGAATVLLFGVPSGALSQPWALFAGNLLSALMGVACYQGVVVFAGGGVIIAAALAVGLAIAVMFLFRCVHPPGGATALAAVVGGESLHQLGFLYVLSPTLVNCCIIFSVAFVFNNLFGWRRYPASLSPQQHSSEQRWQPGRQAIEMALNNNREDLPREISADDIYRVIEQAQQFEGRAADLAIEVGARYSNGSAGFDWSVREVTELVSHADPDHNLVLYRVVDGRQRHRRDSCSVEEFGRWAKQRLQR